MVELCIGLFLEISGQKKPTQNWLQLGDKDLFMLPEIYYIIDHFL